MQFASQSSPYTSQIQNAMTVDVEDWHHSISSVPYDQWDHYESRLQVGLDKILALFDSYRIRATFFILGYVARRYPECVRRIQRLGHEVGTHGDSHRLVYRLSPREFREDLRRSLDALENITQKKVLGFRAPYWTITRESYWAWIFWLKKACSMIPVSTRSRLHFMAFLVPQLILISSGLTILIR